jgi:phosphatidylglycerophosphate synthase
MPGRPGILRSIVWNVTLFFVFQAIVLATTWLAWRVQGYSLVAAWAASLGWHVVLGVFLVVRRADFRLEGTAQPLERVNISNTLTIGRLSSIPTMIVLLLLATSYPVMPLALPFICLMFATDFVDGIFARRRHEITFVGRYLDASGDYVAIIAPSILFFVWRMIPPWFFILLMARLWLFAIGMFWVALREGQVRPGTTFAGKASVFAVMVLYALEVAKLLRVPAIGDPTVVRIVEYATTVVIGVSIVDKAIYLARALAGRPTNRRDDDRGGMRRRADG